MPVTLLAIDELAAHPPSTDDVVVYGGTFDPPHEGHISCIQRLVPYFQKIIVAPTAQNPWKEEKSSPVGIRCEMLKAIVRYYQLPLVDKIDDPGVNIQDFEFTYAEEVVRALKPRLKGKLYWAVAEDSADGVKNWRNWASLDVPTIVLPILHSIHATSIREGTTLIHPALTELVKQYRLYR